MKTLKDRFIDGVWEQSPVIFGLIDRRPSSRIARGLSGFVELARTFSLIYEHP